jgi:hypothetical protein
MRFRLSNLTALAAVYDSIVTAGIAVHNFCIELITAPDRLFTDYLLSPMARSQSCSHASIMTQAYSIISCVECAQIHFQPSSKCFLLYVSSASKLPLRSKFSL